MIKKVEKQLKHWTKFKKDNHVGFRDPMILWSDLKKLPKLYFKD